MYERASTSGYFLNIQSSLCRIILLYVPLLRRQKSWRPLCLINKFALIFIEQSLMRSFKPFGKASTIKNNDFSLILELLSSQCSIDLLKWTVFMITCQFISLTCENNLPYNLEQNFSEFGSRTKTEHFYDRLRNPFHVQTSDRSYIWQVKKVKKCARASLFD